MTQVQVLLGLCLASFAVAAPQVGSRRTVTTTSQGVSSNPDQIVSSVLSSLQQPIAIAVAEALKGLKTTRTVTTTGSLGLGAGRFSSTTGSTAGFGNTNSGFSSSSLSSSKSGSSSANTGLNSFAKRISGFGKSGLSGATSGIGVARGVSTKSVVASQSSKPVELGPYLKPAYNFEYKVSDDSAQTYISREEARDGTELTGSYNFVDPTGALVTVNYNAGVGGYEETRQVQDGAVQIIAQPVSTYESSFESSSAAADLAASQYAEAQRLATQQAAAQRIAAEQAAAQRLATQQAAAQRAAQQKSAAAFRAQQAALKIASEKKIAAEKAAAQRLSATTSSTSNSNTLIANIIAALQPQIGAAVQSAVGSSRSVSSRTPVVQTSSIRAVSAPVPSVRTVSVRTEAVPSSSSSGFSVSSSQSSGLSSSSSQASGLSSLFGNGGNVVRIATPKFQVEY